MKEYLVKTQEGKWHYTNDDHDFCPKHVEKIEIPEGAEIFVFNKGAGEYSFYKEDASFYCLKGYLDWDGSKWTMKELVSKPYIEILWKRQPENQEPLDGVKWLEGDLKEAKLDKQLSKVDLTLLERQSQYGCFEDVAFVTQGIIALLRKCNYDNMPQPHQMALYMIASKMARLVNGDHNHLDSWHDIGGYSKLIENLIGGENE